MTNASTTVPLVDLGLQHRRIADRVSAAVTDVMDQTAFILGPHVDKFENEFAQYCQTAHCVGVGNGTDALELAIRAAGVQQGDEVIIPANTFVATAEAVERAGGTVVLADCDERFLLDADSVASALTARTKAVIPVHLYGQLAPIDDIRAAVGDSVLIIEDAAQSQGAGSDGQRSGSLGIVAATSFYPGKNLGAYGDAGAVTTSSVEIADRIRAMRNHGGTVKYEHRIAGTNSRLDGIQAAILSIKLKHLDSWNAERRNAAALYSELLADLEVVDLPAAANPANHVWHLYVIRVARRHEVLAALQAAGIGAAIHYPAPIHWLPAFSHLEPRDTKLTNSERFADEILTLPLFPGITISQQEFVASHLKTALHRAGAFVVSERE